MRAPARLLTVAALLGITLVGFPPATAEHRQGAPVVTVRGAEVKESAGSVRLPVRVSRNAARPIIISWAVVGGTAHTGSDLSRSRGRLTIPTGEDSATIRVSLKDDKVAENTEFFFVNLFAEGAGLNKKRVKVHLLDDRTDAAVRELRGPVTISETVSDGFNFQTWTISMDFRPVSPDPAAGGDWRDGGSSTWALTGYSASPATCAFPTSVYRGSGTFAPGADPASVLPLGTGAAVLRGFRPREKSGSPRLDVAVSGHVTTTTYQQNSDGSCTTTTTTSTAMFRATVDAEPGGLPGKVFGRSPTTRGVSFDYTNGFVGRGSKQTIMRGALFPVA